MYRPLNTAYGCTNKSMNSSNRYYTCVRAKDICKERFDYHEEKIKNMEENYTSVTKRISSLEKKVEKLKRMIYYMPGQEGAMEAERDFEERVGEQKTLLEMWGITKE